MNKAVLTNWMPSASTIPAIISLVINLLRAVDGDTTTVYDESEVMLALSTIGLGFSARQYNKSDEESGAKGKPTIITPSTPTEPRA